MVTKKHLNIILANAPIKSGNMGSIALSISMLNIIDYDIYLPDSGYKDCDLMEFESYKFHVCDYFKHVNLKTILKKN